MVGVNLLCGSVCTIKCAPDCSYRLAKIMQSILQRGRNLIKRVVAIRSTVGYDGGLNSTKQELH